MAQIIEQDATATVRRPHTVQGLQAHEIARDLDLMDEMEAFVQRLPKRTQGRSATPQELREMAYEDREAPAL